MGLKPDGTVLESVLFTTNSREQSAEGTAELAHLQMETGCPGSLELGSLPA